jgi:PPOX class probable F420-dependent enzyme
MENMTKDEYLRFLMDVPRTGKLATVRADGRAHVVPIWFDLDGDVLVFSCGSGSVKARNMRRDPRITLCVDDEKPPFSFVMLEGTVEIMTFTPEEMLPWTTRIARRYMGDALAEAYGKRNAVLDELIVRITPTNVVAQRNISD